MTTVRQIRVAIWLTICAVVIDCAEYGHRAYLTHLTMKALVLQGQDALSVRVKFLDEIGQCVFGGFVICCQVGVLALVRRLAATGSSPREHRGHKNDMGIGE